MRKCPFCAEVVQADAIKCKHCREMIGPVPSWSLVSEVAGAAATPVASTSRLVQTPLPTVSHALVWVNAFVPLAGMLLNALLDSASLSRWITVPVLVGINCILCTVDEAHLKSCGLDTGSLGSATFVPVYLFRRVGLVSGGYGYAVCWAVAFTFSLIA